MQEIIEFHSVGGIKPPQNSTPGGGMTITCNHGGNAVKPPVEKCHSGGMIKPPLKETIPMIFYWAGENKSLFFHGSAENRPKKFYGSMGTRPLECHSVGPQSSTTGGVIRPPMESIPGEGMEIHDKKHWPGGGDKPLIFHRSNSIGSIKEHWPGGDKPKLSVPSDGLDVHGQNPMAHTPGDGIKNCHSGGAVKPLIEKTNHDQGTQIIKCHAPGEGINTEHDQNAKIIYVN